MGMEKHRHHDDMMEEGTESTLDVITEDLKALGRHYKQMRKAKKAARAAKQDIYVDVMDDLDDPNGEMRDYYYVVSPTGEVTRN